MKVISLIATASAAATLFAAGCACTHPQSTAQTSPAPAYAAHNQRALTQDDFVGARGPDGPAGARGAPGPAGQTGSAGYAVAGTRGEAGPAGPTGPEGQRGARGPAGQYVRGPTGEAGPAGVAGADGPVGQTGARGASADGYAGPAGPAGPTGPRGPVGATGERGPALVGPAGPAGRAGPVGDRGEVGQVGTRGATTPGVAGAVGVAGPAGPRGDAGSTGPMGPTGLVENWASYRDFWFDQNAASIHDADRYLVMEIAEYMRANPSLELGIDASTNPRATSQRDLGLRDNRVKAIRDSLISAGVPASRISAGAFGNLDHRRNGRVEVLLRTDRQAWAQLGEAAQRATASRQSGAQGSIGVVENWSTHQSFWFESNTSSIHAADRAKVAEIAAFMERNPSLQIGIDNTPNPDQRNYDRDLAARRGNAVRDALIAAGVPSSNIYTGAFGDAELRRDGRVEVLVKTDRLAQAR